MKENLKPYVYKHTKHVKVRCGTFCRTVRRVNFASEVKILEYRSRREIECEKREEFVELDPKPGDLSMCRLKRE